MSPSGDDLKRKRRSKLWYILFLIIVTEKMTKKTCKY